MPKQWKLSCLSAVPALLTAMLFLVYIAPKHINGLGTVMPLLHIVPIYLWSILQVRHMPLWFLAVLGLVADSAIGLPLGLSALVYCMAALAIRSQRKYIVKENFLGLWGYFALSMLCLQLLYWAGYMVLISAFTPINEMLMQWVLTVLLYPPLHYLLYPLIEKLSETRYRLLHA